MLRLQLGGGNAQDSLIPGELCKTHREWEISGCAGSEEHGEVLVQPRTKDNEAPAEICVRNSRSVLVEIKTGEKLEKNKEWEQRTGLTD